MRRLEEDNSIRITFEKLDSIYGLLYKGLNDKYLIVINSNLSPEKQLETIWHESKHLYSHDMEEGDMEVIEKEAVEFSKYALEYSPEVLSECRNAW
ncbi:ImmA/IrrE family metallo-endopeptidase [Oxobacter pfennigii]|nr:ImmA/IrrE family metallo-endopeptidase [Oxobacter pfennigii]